MEKPNTPEGANMAQPARWRWMHLVLVVSLGLNLLVAGVVLGGLYRLQSSDRSLRDFSQVGLLPFATALDRRDRAAVMDDIRALMPQIRQGRAQMRENSSELIAALQAMPFDPASLPPLFAALRDSGAQLHGMGEAALIARLNQMSDAERQHYAKRLERSLARGARRSARSGG